MNTSKQTIINTFAGLITGAETFIQSLEARARHFEHGGYVVKVNAVYYVGDNGDGAGSLTNAANAYAFPTREMAEAFADRATFTHQSTGKKFKAEAVLHGRTAMLAELEKAAATLAELQRGLEAVAQSN